MAGGHRPSDINELGVVMPNSVMESVLNNFFEASPISHSILGHTGSGEVNNLFIDFSDGEDRTVIGNHTYSDGTASNDNDISISPYTPTDFTSNDFQLRQEDVVEIERDHGIPPEEIQRIASEMFREQLDSRILEYPSVPEEDVSQKSPVSFRGKRKLKM